ncbi:biotin carboxylase 2, chloroplastic isoform X1 [Cryptomeria japonica]|uniref:biotin carboxylase 2, chloroplastic isoform X1 n=1 Tax=Cryptomeria japonica TaxID=3369 RepID=UPI0027DA2936|nr:biotin carboxylase 2, chloroplastic isoform X1 [Cryptomeria japonica]
MQNRCTGFLIIYLASVFSSAVIQQARSEAGAAFGNDDVYLERYIKNSRHIEFQQTLDLKHLPQHDCFPCIDYDKIVFA